MDAAGAQLSSEDVFHEHASGLLVPNEIARERRVATKAEWRAYEAALKAYKRLGIRVQMACEKPGCSRIRGIRAADGGAILRCDCTDRVFQAAF